MEKVDHLTCGAISPVGIIDVTPILHAALSGEHAVLEQQYF